MDNVDIAVRSSVRGRRVKDGIGKASYIFERNASTSRKWYDRDTYKVTIND